jgi:hypothetical protein
MLHPKSYTQDFTKDMSSNFQISLEYVHSERSDRNKSRKAS